MSRTNKNSLKMTISNLYILYIGDVDRGKRLLESVKSCDFDFHFELDIQPAQNICIKHIPDLVILDGFPESKSARAVFYQLRSKTDVRFISLNDSPHAIKYVHIGALSFIRMINRDPKPNQLVNAILDMIRSKHELHSQCPGAVNLERKTEGFKSICLSYRCGNACC